MNAPRAAGNLVALWPLARQLVAREWRHHPWRHGVAMLAVALGVALAWSVHLINRSALAEFSSAVRSANGEPDLVLRGQRAGFDERLFERAAADAAVVAASPVVEVESFVRDAAGRRLAVRVLGVDALRVAPLAAALMPVPGAGEPPLASLDPGRVFINGPLRDGLRAAGADATTSLQLQAGPRWHALAVAGHVALWTRPRR